VVWLTFLFGLQAGQTTKEEIDSFREGVLEEEIG